MQQQVSSVFTMPDGSPSDPVVTVRNPGEGLDAFLNRHKEALRDAIAAAYS